MKLHQIKRKLLNVRLMMISNGYKKADILRRKKIFGKIGREVYYQPYLFGTEPHLIFLHDYVHIAANVSLVTHDIVGLMIKKNYPTEKEQMKNVVGPIVIKENVFVGSGSIILPNVIIESNVIVAAGSIVTKNIETGVIVGGNPAKVIGRFDDYVKKVFDWSDSIDWDEFIDSRELLIEKQYRYFKVEN